MADISKIKLPGRINQLTGAITIIINDVAGASLLSAGEYKITIVGVE